MSESEERKEIAEVSGPEFRVLQRPDLRWHFEVEGKLSDRTYPTAGEAQRGAEAYILATRRKPVGFPWQWLLVLAAAAVPVIYVLMLLLRLVGL
jgi:hypothetical protein